MATTHKMSTEMEKCLTTFNEESREIYIVSLPQAIKKLTELQDHFKDQGLVTLPYSRQIREAIQSLTHMSDDPKGQPKSTTLEKDDPESETNAKSDEPEKETVDKPPRKEINQKPEEEAETEPQNKRMELDEGRASSLLKEIMEKNDCLTCSPILQEMIASLKPFFSEGIQHSLGLARWMSTYFTPSHTNDNAVIEECRKSIYNSIQELSMVCTEGLHSLANFTSKRAKTVSKMLKNPSVTDYRAAVRDQDENMIIGVFTSMLSLRNAYVVLYDGLSKNMEQLETFSKMPVNLSS